jgi:hypothetical protein
VVRFYGVSYHQGDFYIVTEHCSNTLAQILQQHHAAGERLDEEDLYRIAFQVRFVYIYVCVGGMEVEVVFGRV